MFYLIQEEEMAILDNLIQFLYAQYLLLISLSISFPFQPFILSFFQATHYSHKYNETLLSHRKEWNWVFCSDVDGPKVYHTEWNKSEKEKNKYHLIHIHMEYRKSVQMNLFSVQ